MAGPYPDLGQVLTEGLARGKTRAIQEKQLDLEGRRVKVEEDRLQISKDAQKRADILQLLREQTEKRKQETEASTLRLNQGKQFFTDFGTIFKNRQDITTNEMKSFVDIAVKNYGIDESLANGMFQPNVDEKTGNTKSYTSKGSDFATVELDKRVKEQQIQTSKAEEALKIIDAKAKQEEIRRGRIPKEFAGAIIDRLWSDPGFKKLTPSEQIGRLNQEMWKLPTAATQIMPQGVKKNIQESMIGTIKQTHYLENIERTFNKDMLTYQGKLWNAAIRVGLKSKMIDSKDMSPADRKFHEDYRIFYSSNKMLMAQFTNDMSGANFSVKEMDRYDNALFSEKLDDVEYKAVFNDYMRFTKKAYRIRDTLLMEGFQGDKNALGQEVDKLMFMPNDPTLDPKVRDKRGDFLAEEYKKTKPDAEQKDIESFVVKQLKREGYL